jgi:two-component system CheB/CheR fusion protein
MIYLDARLQKQLIPMFHFALNPGGFLFLGTSETIGEFHDLFGVIDRKAKLFQRNHESRGARPKDDRCMIPSIAVSSSTPQPDNGAKHGNPKRPSYREITEQALLRHISAAAALVNGKGDILYIQGRTGTYLEPAQGEQGVSNVLKMAREGLKRELTAALHKASGFMSPASGIRLQVNRNDRLIEVNFFVYPLKTHHITVDSNPLYLVVFEEAGLLPESKAQASEQTESCDDGEILALKRELQAKEEYLLTANEELETTNDELQSANEEMQSVNEELQSTNEELETSKEELQSVNEELITVNAELQTKLYDISQANNDMNNLLAGTNIATVFVDQQLRILRFTPSAAKIINLIPSDMGRSVGHIVSNLEEYDQLIEDTQAVLDTRIPKELEVMTTNGMWFTLRIQPYRTLENVIEGAVITFMDITEIVKTREALREANHLLNQAGNKALDERALQKQNKNKHRGVK